MMQYRTYGFTVLRLVLLYSRKMTLSLTTIEGCRSGV
jgi:hypothetical protein